MDLKWFIIPLWYTVLYCWEWWRCCYAVNAEKFDCAIVLLLSRDEITTGTSVYYPTCSVVPYKFPVYVLFRELKAVSLMTAFSLCTSIQSHLTNDAFCSTLNRKCEYLGLKKARALKYCDIKVKQSRNRPGVAQRVPGGLGSQITTTFGTWRWWGRQPHAPATFTPRNVTGTHFH
jgi:hypothetical protein